MSASTLNFLINVTEGAVVGYVFGLAFPRFRVWLAAVGCYALLHSFGGAFR